MKQETYERLYIFRPSSIVYLMFEDMLLNRVKPCNIIKMLYGILQDMEYRIERYMEV